jgi:hypothetical protein
MTCRLHRFILVLPGAAGVALCLENQRSWPKEQGLRMNCPEGQSLNLIDALDIEYP